MSEQGPSPAEAPQPPSGRIVLRSDNDSVELRQLVPEDASTYFALVEVDRVHLSQHGDETAEKYPTVESVAQSITHPDNPQKYRFGIWDNGEMVGTYNLTPEEGNRAELGTWVAANHLGQHYAVRAGALAREFAFNQLGLDEVYVEIALGNEPSRRSAEKSGYQLTETTDDHWTYTIKRPRQA